MVYHQVAHPSGGRWIFSTSWRYFEWSCAHIHAVLRPRLWGWRSSSIVWSHVRLGRPAWHLQSTRGRLMAAWRICECSCDGSALARCPNRRSRLFAITEVIGGWPVLRLLSSLVMCVDTGIPGIPAVKTRMNVIPVLQVVHVFKDFSTFLRCRSLQSISVFFI